MWAASKTKIAPTSSAIALNGSEVVTKYFEQTGQTRQLEDYYLEAIAT